MSVNAGAAGEYERRHRPIWEDLEKTLFEHGVHAYSVYLDSESLDLFAYVELEDEDLWNRIATTDACRRWWRFMRDIMPVNADSSPVSRDLREVFHIDRERAARRTPLPGEGDN